MAAALAASFLGPAIDLVKLVGRPIGRQFNYLCCFTSNIDSLKDEAKKLDDATKGLQGEVDRARDNVQEPAPEVQSWLDDSKKINDEINGILDEAKNVGTGCLKLRARFSLSKRAKKTTDRTKELRGEKPNAEFQPGPPAARQAVQLGNTFECESRNKIEDGIMTTLRGGDVNMIGICGMGGLGKTTMARKIRNRVLNEMTVVSQQVVSQQEVHPLSDRIPTPKSPLHRSAVIKLIRAVTTRRSASENLDALKKLEDLAADGDKNQQCMAEAGAAKSMISYVLRCFDDGYFSGVDRALRILRLTWSPAAENKQMVEEKFFESILWILNSKLENSAKTDALIVLKNAVEVANSSILEKLKPSFFKEMVKILRMQTSAAATKAVLKTLIETCPPGWNRMKVVEAGAVFELIEMELGIPEKKTTELIFCLLAHLCSCADGRQQFLRHAGGVGMVAKRLLRVSLATDDRALCIYESIARFSATRAVVAEMLTVAGVTKLCMILQADCDVYLKKKAREILRLHSKVWSNSPCIQLYLLTRYAR